MPGRGEGSGSGAKTREHTNLRHRLGNFLHDVGDEGGLIHGGVGKALKKNVGQSELAAALGGRKGRRAEPPAPTPPTTDFVHSDFSTDSLPTDKGVEKRGRSLKHRDSEIPYDEQKELQVGLEKVYPEFEKYWYGHATKIVELYDRSKKMFQKGSPHYYQWEVVEQFLDTKGVVSREKIREFFMKPDAYNFTMTYMDFEASKMRYMQGIMTETKSNEITRTEKDLLHTGAVLPSGSTKFEQVAQGAAKLGVAAGLVGANATFIGAPAIIGAVIGIASAFPPLFDAVGLTTLNVAGFATAGGLMLGANAINTIWHGLSTDRRKEVVLACLQGLTKLQQDAAECDYLRKIYGVDPRGLQVNGDKIEFVPNKVYSNSYDRARQQVHIMEDLRRKFMVDVVGVDPDKVYDSLEQFIIHKNHLPNQTGAKYEARILDRFYELTGGVFPPNERIARDKLYQAELEILQEDATRFFLDKPSEREQRQIRKNKAAVKARAESLTSDTGEERKRAQAIATAQKVAAEATIEGAQTAGGNKIPGIKLLKETFSTESTTQPGLEQQIVSSSEAYATVKGLVKDIPNVLLEANGETIADIRRAIQAIDSALDAGAPAFVGPPPIAARPAGSIIRQKNAINALYAQQRIDTMQAQQANARSDSALTAALTAIEAERAKQVESIETQEAQLKTKRSELVKTLQALEQSYAKLSIVGSEHVRIDNLKVSMNREYVRVIGLGLNQALLVDYPRVGHELNVIMGAINAAMPNPNAWPATENTNHERIMVVMNAITEAKALALHNNLNLPLAGHHLGLLNPVEGNLTSEQLLAMSPYEIYDAVAGRMAMNYAIRAVNAPYPAAELTGIRAAQSEERARYNARRQALQEVLGIQESALQTATEQADPEKVKIRCSQQAERMQIVSKIIEDSGEAYRRVPEMLGSDVLTWTDTRLLGTVDPAEQREFYPTERMRNLPVGAYRLLRTILSYDTTPVDGIADPDRRAKAMLDALSETNTSRVFADIIIDSFPGFRNLISMPAFDAFIVAAGLLPPPADNAYRLSLVDVLSVIQHKQEGTAYTILAGAFAVPAAAPSAITAYEAKSLMKGFVDRIVRKTVNGN